VAVMKLSQLKKDDVLKAIMGIYDVPEKRLKNLRDTLVCDNHALWIAPFQATIDTLPLEMFQKDDDLILEVGYEGNNHNWYAMAPKQVIVCREGSGYYSKTIPMKVVPTLQSRVESIQAEEAELLQEKVTLRTFTEECLDKVTTTKQLHELWANYPALSKHIPPEPVRAKKAKQQLLDLESSLDLNAVNKRLTENLLEG